MLAQLDFAPDPGPAASTSLGFAERQLVAIAKALRRRCRIFILDEPTAALEKREIERLFSVLARMKGQGTAIVYVSHRLDEVVAHRRPLHGSARRPRRRRQRGAARSPCTISCGAMTGRAAEEVVAAPVTPGEVLLEARQDDAATRSRLRAREVVGLAGLLGSGAGRMLRRLFGVASRRRSRCAARRRRLRSPADAIAAGIGMVPGERRLGLVMNQSVRDNILLPNLAALSRLGVLDRARRRPRSSPS